MQYSRWSLIRAEYMEIITSLSLLASPPLMQPKIQVAFRAASTCYLLMRSFSSTSTPPCLLCTAIFHVYTYPTCTHIWDCINWGAAPCTCTCWASLGLCGLNSQILFRSTYMCTYGTREERFLSLRNTETIQSRREGEIEVLAGHWEEFMAW